jgi:hypothetical protein
METTVINHNLYIELLEAEVKRLRARVEYNEKPHRERQGATVARMLGVTESEAAPEFTPPRNLTGGTDAD